MSGRAFIIGFIGLLMSAAGLNLHDIFVMLYGMTIILFAIIFDIETIERRLNEQ